MALADKTILTKALAAENLPDALASQIIRTGRVTMTGSYVTQADVTALAGRINRAYSREVAHTFAKKHGWTVKSDAKGKLTLNKRSF